MVSQRSGLLAAGGLAMSEANGLSAKRSLSRRRSNKTQTMVKISRKEVSIFFYFLFLIALFCSKTLLTIAMIGLLAIGVFEIQLKPFRLGFNPNYWNNLKELPKRKDLLAVIGIFLLIVLSFWNSEATEDWGKHIRVKLPFLLLPLAFIQLPRLSKRGFSHVLYICLLLATVACIGTGINYALDYEYITNSIRLGKSIPTPIHHIRFSLMIAFTVVVGVWLHFSGYYWKKPFERNIIVALTGFLFIFQHVLSVRSGLVVLYAALGIMSIYFVFYTKKIKFFAILLPILVIIPLIAVKTVPTLKNKIGYLWHDLEKFRNGHRAGFSDGQRFISWEIGGAVFQKNQLWGTGFGDLKNELTVVYEERYPDLKPKLPHNQFLLFAAGMGCTGLLAFLTLFFFPLFYKKNYRSVVFAAFYTIITISFLFENTLSSALGTGIYLFFLLILMQREEGTIEN
jgi:O-antigen ligase